MSVTFFIGPRERFPAPRGADNSARPDFVWPWWPPSAEDAAELYIANTIGISRHFCMKEGEEYPLRNCPNYDNEALVFEEGYTESNGVCFACGDTPSPGEYVSCDQCQELCRDEDRSGGMCTDCLRAYLSADHWLSHCRGADLYGGSKIARQFLVEVLAKEIGYVQARITARKAEVWAGGMV